MAVTGYIRYVQRTTVPTIVGPKSKGPAWRPAVSEKFRHHGLGNLAEQ